MPRNCLIKGNLRLLSPLALLGQNTNKGDKCEKGIAHETAKSVAKSRAFYPFCTFTMPMARPQYGHLAMGASSSATSTSSAIAMRWSVSRLGELAGLRAVDTAPAVMPIFAAKSLCVIPFSCRMSRMRPLMSNLSIFSVFWLVACKVTENF